MLTRPVGRRSSRQHAISELAHAIAGALTLPNDVADRDELDYLRATRDRARIVLFAMRRIIADHDLDDDDLVSIVATIRDSTSQLAAGDTTAANPYSAFIEAIIATLSISPCSPETSKQAYLHRPVSAPAASCWPVAAPSRVRGSPQQWTGWFGRNGCGIVRGHPGRRSVPRRALPSSGQVRSSAARSSSRGIAALAHQCARGRQGFLAGEGSWAGGRART